VHGGPTISFVRDFNLEFQAQAGSGHAVILCNPRGSSGYGAAFSDGDLAWGQESIDDLFDFTDAAVKLGFIDEENIGITGGSYGGYMTIKIIGRSTKYKAACGQRILCNGSTSYGTGDRGSVYNEKKIPLMLTVLTDRAKRSYVNQIDNVSAPLLLLHGTNDYRCSFEQAEQMFIAMKERRPQIPVRFVAFPGENHGVSRTGRPESQKTHMSEMINWFTRYLEDNTAEEVTKDA
jgi:dipeptidyl aminopeptidase/acylaminoacyl peptidase